MTDTHPNRPDKRLDLTRWNRAGLSKFAYTDGDAAVWLEELRIALLGHYMRGAAPDQRVPEVWRDAFLRDPKDWPDAATAQSLVQWDRLAPKLPPAQDTRGRRNKRLLEQYAEKTDDYSWEIARAFARASHILMGTLDAYANEGYLRTATQWDNLRRLAAMVNYQPTPPASATTTLALLLKEDAGPVELAAGLAMKHTPPDGAVPLIFETFEKVTGHPLLNAARAVDWDVNARTISFGDERFRPEDAIKKFDQTALEKELEPVLQSRALTWLLPKKETLAPGDLVVVADGTQGHASLIGAIDQDTEAETALIQLTDVPDGSFVYHSTRLMSQAQDVRRALPITSSGKSIVKANAAAFAPGDLVQVRFGDETGIFKVIEAIGNELTLDADFGAFSEVELIPMVPFAKANGRYMADLDTTQMHFLKDAGPVTQDRKPLGEEPVASEFTPGGGVVGEKGFVVDAQQDTIMVEVKPGQPIVLPDPDKTLQTKTVSFEGKPPKGLSEGDWFAVRNLTDDSLSAVQVVALRVGSDEYHLVLSKELSSPPEKSEFHGPMTLATPISGYNRNPDRALSGGKVQLEHISTEARKFLKPGRKMIITTETGDTTQSVLVTLAEIIARGSTRVELVIDPVTAAATWTKGKTVFHLNTAQISHGETKGAKLLGSGDGERSRQDFAFAIRNVAHIPSAVSESGVVPALDIAVDDELWTYRDFIDPSAEGTKSWSTTLQDDDTLTIHFRRRLVTGQNNVRVLRHRVGAGQAGSNIPAFSFDKPMKKNRFVDAVFQPFPTAGGADREPVSQLRQSAPQRLAANGRAVSLTDFEGLAVRHASILQAHAEEMPTPGASRMVSLTLAPVGGGAITTSMEDDLRAAIVSKAVPGTSLRFRLFETLPLTLAVRVRADLTVHDKSEIKAAAEDVLATTFSLEVRKFGQAAYISECLAALETVPGIETAIATRFDLGDAYDLTEEKPDGFTLPWPRNVATRDDEIAAIYATDHQIIFVPEGDTARIAVVVEDIR